MSQDFTIVVGTVGDGLWRSADGGASFERCMNAETGSLLNTVDTIVKGLAVDPHDPRHVIAGMGFNATPYSPWIGSSHALLESFDGGHSWKPIENFPKLEVWRFAFDPVTPGRYFVGTRPGSIWRTADGGTSFEKLPVDTPEECPGIGLTRVTSIVFHPDDTDVMIATIEIGGVHRSLDGGDSWDRVMDDIEVPLPEGNVYGEFGRDDCHFARFVPGDPAVVLISTPDVVYVSDDLGKTWDNFGVQRAFPHQYHRDIAVKLDDPSTIFVGTGDDVAGFEGAIQRTRDGGATWETVDLPDECNSPVWCFGQHPSDPDTIIACTHKGMLFGSRDGGESWTKYRREFSEVRVICWTPG